MKRQWRAGRVILAVMLWATAVLVYALWPASCWKMPAEEVIGFDDAKGLLYTVQFVEDHHELHALDLASGSRQKTVTLSTVTSKVSSGIVFVDLEGPVSPSDRIKQLVKGWRWILSPNKQVLIAINDSQDNFQLLELETGQLIKRISIPHMFSASDVEVGFSRDGHFFAMQDGFDRMNVWDLRSGETIDQLDFKIGGSLMSSGRIYLNHLVLSSSINYLAFTHKNMTYIRNLKDKSLCPPTCGRLQTMRTR